MKIVESSRSTHKKNECWWWWVRDEKISQLLLRFLSSVRAAPKATSVASCHQFRALLIWLINRHPFLRVRLWLELTRVFDLIQMRWFRALDLVDAHPKERHLTFWRENLNRFKFSLAILFFSSGMPRCQVVYDNRLQLIAKVACARALKLHLFLVDSTQKTELSPLCVACRRARRLYNREKKREKSRNHCVMAFQVVAQIAIEVRYHSLFTHRAQRGN